MVPEFPNFTSIHNISPREYAKLVEAFEPYSDYNFTSLFAWSGQEGCGVAKLNNHLVISFQDYQSGIKFLSFIGTDAVDDTARILLDFVAKNPEYDDALYLVPEVTAQALGQYFEVIEDRDNHDYILSAAKYVDLPGKEFANKRKNIQRFKKLYGGRVAVRPLDIHDDANKKDIMRLVTSWFDYGTEGARTAENEAVAIEKLLYKYAPIKDTNPLHILGLFVEEKLEGFCIVEIVNSNYAMSHFGKANLQYMKSYEYLMVETLRYIYNNFQIDLVNYEQDLGIQGLRQNKLNHHPVGFLKKYIVRPAVSS